MFCDICVEFEFTIEQQQLEIHCSHLLLVIAGSLLAVFAHCMLQSIVENLNTNFPLASGIVLYH